MYRFTTIHHDRIARASRRSSFDVRNENARQALEATLEYWPLDTNEAHLEDVLERLELGQDQILKLEGGMGAVVFLEIERVAA